MLSDALTARLAVGATVLSLVLAALAALGGHPPSSVVLAALGAFVPYAGLFLWSPGWDRRRAVLWSLVLAAGVGVLLVAAPPVLSDDLFRYLWDGRVLGYGIDPYRHAPDHPALAHLRDDLWQRVNNPEVPTIYPPVAQALFAAADAIHHGPASIKVLALLAHLALIPLVAAVAGPERPRAALLYGLNPLALVETALAGHVDVVAGLAVLGCVAVLRSGRPVVAAVLAGLASGVKLVGLAVAPLVGTRSRAAAFLALGLAVLPVLPLLGAGGGDAVGGLGQYARRWRGNEGPFVLVEGVARGALQTIGDDAHAAPGHVRLPFLRAPLEAVRGTPFDPRAGLTAEKKGVPDLVDFELAYLAAVLARGLVVAFVLGLALVLAWRRADPLLAARWVLLAGLLLAPQVHPWYLLWLLPLEVASGRVAGIVWSAAILVAYAPLDAWLLARAWDEPVLGRVLQYAVVLTVLFCERRWIGKNTPARVVPVVRRGEL